MRWPAWLYRLVPYLGRRAAERDVEEELRLHVELERESRRDAGIGNYRRYLTSCPDSATI